jgi:hypothetical protein
VRIRRIVSGTTDEETRRESTRRPRDRQECSKFMGFAALASRLLGESMVAGENQQETEKKDTRSSHKSPPYLILETH